MWTLKSCAVFFALATGAGLCLWGEVASANTFHVSPFGSNTPPYDTYAKAAHQVADAVMAASGYGDTVLVHTGTYNFDTTIYIPSGLTWAGVGRDSVVLNWSDTQYRFGMLANLSGNNELLGLEFNYPMGSSFNQAVDGIYSFSAQAISIHDCRFRQLKVSIGGNGPLEARDNEFLHGQTSGIKPGEGSSWVHHNSFWGTTSGEGVMCLYAGSVLIEHNVFNNDATGGRPSGVSIFHASWVVVRNNLMVHTSEPVSWSYASGIVENNTMIGSSGVATGFPVHYTISGVLRSFETLLMRNNIMYDFDALYEFSTASYQCCDTTGLITFVHNAFWPPIDSFFTIWPTDQSWRVKILDSANLIAFPMFVPDSLFQLQHRSPLIDAGDPAVKDADSSRADIGWWGGSQGSSYPYLDLQPRAPESLRYNYDYPHVTLWWRANHETDLDHYSLHRGTNPGFIPAIGNQINMTWGSDTTYTDSLEDSLTGAYYKVVAVDALAQWSAPSNEVAVIPTGVFDADEPDAGIPRSPRLLGNYPNPFNNSTVFTVTIPAVGASPAPVEIVIYDALGRRVTVAYQGDLHPGTHQIAWNGSDSAGHALASGVYFAKLQFWSLTINESVKVVIVR